MQPQKICARIVEYALARAGEQKVKEVRIGLGYTAVLLENGNLGLALTGRPETRTCTVAHWDRPLAGRLLKELVSFCGQPDHLHAAVGLAAVNALANTSAVQGTKGDVLAALQLDKQVRVGMVGYFGPLVPVLEKRAKSLLIFEQQERPGCLPAHQALDQLPACDVVLITSTTLINNTIDELLAVTTHCQAVVLIGASTPLLPEVFAPTPVTQLAGIVVQDPDAVLRVISEGGGTRQFQPWVCKVNVACPQKNAS